MEIEHAARVAAIARWLGWVLTPRGWRRIVEKSNRKIGLYEPVATWDPWIYEADMHTVWQAVKLSGYGEEAVSRWASSWCRGLREWQYVAAEFLAAEPGTVMDAVWDTLQAKGVLTPGVAMVD